MAIPIRGTITCPACGVSEAVIIADTSVGPIGRTSETPVYSMLEKDLWPQTRREVDGCMQTFLSCASCGTKEFATVNQLADRWSI